MAIEELQAGTSFLVVYRVAAFADEPLERGRPSRLAGDAEVSGGQRSDKRRQTRVTQPLVMRTPSGKRIASVGPGRTSNVMRAVQREGSREGSYEVHASL